MTAKVVNIIEDRDVLAGDVLEKTWLLQLISNDGIIEDALSAFCRVNIVGLEEVEQTFFHYSTTSTKMPLVVYSGIKQLFYRKIKV